MSKAPSLSHVTEHFVPSGRIAVRLERPNNTLNNAYRSLRSSSYFLLARSASFNSVNLYLAKMMKGILLQILIFGLARLRSLLGDLPLG